MERVAFGSRRVRPDSCSGSACQGNVPARQESRADTQQNRMVRIGELVECSEPVQRMALSGGGSDNPRSSLSLRGNCRRPGRVAENFRSVRWPGDAFFCGSSLFSLCNILWMEVGANGQQDSLVVGQEQRPQPA